MGYYIRRGTDAAKGPYPASLLRQLAKAGRIRATDEVMPEGATRWYRAWRITDFKLPKPETADAVASKSVEKLVERPVEKAPVASAAARALAPEPLEPPPLLGTVTEKAAAQSVGGTRLRLVGDGPTGSDAPRPVVSVAAVGMPPVDLLLKQTLEIQGLTATPEPGERLVGTIAQDATDVLVCGWGAFLSRLRGAVVASNKRFFICRPRGTGMEYHALDLAAVSRISLEQRLVWRRVFAVVALAVCALGTGGWAMVARSPTTFAMAAEGATALGIAAGLLVLACVLAGRMRHPALVIRCNKGAARETFDLPCQRADRHVVMRMANLLRSDEQPSRDGAAEDLSKDIADAGADEFVERRERTSRGRTRVVVETKPKSGTDTSQWGDVGEVFPLEQYLRDRAVG